MMKSKLSLTLVVIAAFCCAQLHAGSEFAKMVPKDWVALLQVNNVGKIMQLSKKEDGLLSQLMENEGVKVNYETLFSSLEKVLQHKDGFLLEANIDEKKLVSLLSGNMMVGIPDLNMLDDGIRVEVATPEDLPAHGESMNEKSEMSLPGLAAVDFSGSQKDFDSIIEAITSYSNRELKKNDKPTCRIVKETIGGALIYSIETEGDKAAAAKEPSGKYAVLVGQIAIYSANIAKTDLLRLLPFFKKGSNPDAIITRTDFQDAYTQLKNKDIYLFANLEELSKTLEDKIVSILEEQAQKQPMVAMLAPAENFKDAFHLSNFSGLFAGVELQPDSLGTSIGATWKSKEGLVNLLAFKNEKPVVPDFITDEFKNMSVTTFDLSTAWQRLVGVVNTFSPMLIQMGQGNITQYMTLEQLNLLRTGLLDNITGDIIVLTGYSNDAPELTDDIDIVYTVKVKHRDNALEAMSAFVGTLSKPRGNPSTVTTSDEEFLNETLYSISKNNKLKASYGVVDGRLILGEKLELVKRVVRSLKSKSGKGILDNDAVQDVANDMGDKNLVTYSYDDIATVLKGGLNNLWERQLKKQDMIKIGNSLHRFSFKLFGTEEKIEITKETYMDALRAADSLKLFRLTKSFCSDNSFHYTTKIERLSDGK
ncbi:hypothetical protein BVY04_01210 [bacterium M21]|nr:hypothetical protein BVY04_01210 [bacterium M21]